MNLFISELLEQEDLIRVCGRYHCGLELIRFGISDNLDHFHDTLQSAADLLELAGSPSVSLHGPFLDLNPMTFDSRIRQVVLDRFAQAYDAAFKLNAKRIVFHSGMIPTVYFLEGWTERMISFWEDFLPGRTDIPVCMENVLDREYDPFLKIAEALKDKFPSFGICLDAAHAHCYSSHPELVWAEALRGYIRHLHLHDNNGLSDQHLSLGEGNLQWEKVTRVLLESQPGLTVTVECSTAEAVCASLEKLRRLGDSCFPCRKKA